MEHKLTPAKSNQNAVSRLNENSLIRRLRRSGVQWALCGRYDRRRRTGSGGSSGLSGWSDRKGNGDCAIPLNSSAQQISNIIRQYDPAGFVDFAVYATLGQLYIGSQIVDAAGALAGGSVVLQ
jgi:hypothetical protein